MSALPINETLQFQSHCSRVDEVESWGSDSSRTGSSEKGDVGKGTAAGGHTVGLNMARATA